MATVIELSSWERLQLLRNGLLAAYGRRRHRYKRNAQFFDKLKHAGRLSPEQIAELTRAQVAKVDKDHGRRSSLIITDALINLNFP